jgi:hypothetical protein
MHPEVTATLFVVRLTMNPRHARDGVVIDQLFMAVNE